MYYIKKAIVKLLKKYGYEIIPTNNQFPNNDPFRDQKALIPSGEDIIIFDVGAHHGHTALMYNQLFNSCKIYAFEPFQDSYNLLKETVKDHPNIETENTALGNIEGKVDFHVNKLSLTNSILPTHDEGANIWGENLLDTLESIQVNCTTIDDFIKRKNINKIDILKLDTQGTEYNIIEGAVDTIEKNKINIIYLEIILLPTYQKQKYFDEILSLMRRSGFSLFNMYNYSYTKFGVLRQVDAIFICNKFKMY